MSDDELCDKLKGYVETGKGNVGSCCIECFRKYSGHDPYCTAYMSDRRRDEEYHDMMRDVDFER